MWQLASVRDKGTDTVEVSLAVAENLGGNVGERKEGSLWEIMSTSKRNTEMEDLRNMGSWMLTMRSLSFLCWIYWEPSIQYVDVLSNFYCKFKFLKLAPVKRKKKSTFFDRQHQGWQCSSLLESFKDKTRSTDGGPKDLVFLSFITHLFVNLCTWLSMFFICEHTVECPHCPQGVCRHCSHLP